MQIETIIITAISGLLGSAGLWQLLSNRREKNVTTVKLIQDVYKQFVIDTQVELGQLREEVRMLRTIIEHTYENCQNVECPNHKMKKKSNNNN